MKYLKNYKIVAGVALIVLGVGMIAAGFLRTPSREVSRAELTQMLVAKTLTKARLTPTSYAGIYSVEGRHSLEAGAIEKVYLTTHFNESEIKTLFMDGGVKVEVPGMGLKG